MTGMTDSMPQRQQGVALITALLVTALVVFAASAMVWQQQLDMRRTGNVLIRDQAQVFAQGLENFSLGALNADAASTQVDHWGEAWAVRDLPIPFHDAVMMPRIIDLQSRFNVNNMVLNGKPHGLDVVRFQYLILEIQRVATTPPYSEQQLELIRDINPEELANALVDWLDPDGEVRFPGGAEEFDYMGLEKPYRAANRHMADISELQLVKGITPELFQILKRYLVALPVPTGQVSGAGGAGEAGQVPTKINVNTARTELLNALRERQPECYDAGNLDRPEPASVTDLLSDEAVINEGTHYTDVKGFIEDMAGCSFVGALRTKGVATGGQQMADDALSVESEYFLVHAEVTMPSLEGPPTVLDAIVRRTRATGKDAKGVSIGTILRSQGVGQYWLDHI